MSYVPGEPLSARIARGPVPRDQTLACGSRLAEALAHAHGRGVAHLDIKPENVILRAGDGTPVLVDWGLAGGRPQWGTPPYMAPERFDSLRTVSRPVTLAGDVFALGLVLVEAMSGRTVMAEPITEDDDRMLPGIKAEYDRLQDSSWRAVFVCQAIAANPALLDRRVERALAGATAPLLGVVRGMLKDDPRARFTAARSAEALRALTRP
jgi:serine/threonine protein kinase